MNRLFKGLIAAYGAKKLGTGCFSTILIFILIWVALGRCEGTSYGEKRTSPPVQLAYFSIQKNARLQNVSFSTRLIQDRPWYSARNRK